MSFSGFDPADFDAFVPKKQGSNAYTLERRRAKEKLLAVAHQLLETQPSAVEGLELATTEDAPSVANGRKVRSLAAYFVRPAQVRAGLKELLATNLHAGAHLFEIAVHQQHAHLELRIEQSGLAVGVRLPSVAVVDRENFAEKLRLEWAREEWSDLLRGLPPPVSTGFDSNLVPAEELAASDLAQWPDEIQGSDATLIVERLIPRDAPEVASPAWIDEGAALLAEFAPVLRFLAWSRENDHTRVKEAVAKKVEEAAQKAPTLAAGARVTILGGLFAGRSGYVVEIDHKSKAKVMVGPVTITVEAEDLKPAG